MLDYPKTADNPCSDVAKLFEEAMSRFDSGIADEITKSMFEKAAAMGCAEAMVMLGNIYVDGTPEEKSLSLKLFLEAAATGNDSGMRNVAYSYALGLACEKNKEKAAEWYEIAANAGNAKAQCNLGVLYAYGHGVPKDMKIAAKWYKLSAENGYFRGQTNYAELLANGDGVEPNYEEAAIWFRKSGSNRALFGLARMYIEGKGTDVNIETAKDLLKEASDKGYAKATELLSSLSKTNDPMQ